MHFLAPDPAAIVGDPTWLAHRYDPAQDQFHFVRATRADHDAATFLTDEYLPAGGDVVVVPRQAARSLAASPAPLNFLFHSAYCCSTLLARACNLPGTAMGLKEPVVLNDLQGWRQRGGAPADLAQVLADAMTLLARPFTAGEQVVVKPSNVVNGLAPAILAAAPAARAVLMYAPLPLFLGSVARKGMWGRLWVRDLFVKLSRDGLIDYGFSPEEVMRQTDLQIAAVGWLAQHRLFARLIERFGPDRIRTVESEAMLIDPAATMTALDRHFRMDMPAGAVDDIVANAFGRHAKTGERFGATQRSAIQRDDLSVHADEVEKVAAWAEQVAANVGQPLELGHSLI